MTRDEVVAIANQAARSKDSRLLGCGIDDLHRFAEMVEEAEREACAKHLKDAAARLAPEGKRTNQYDRHMTDVLNAKADELLMRSNAVLTSGAEDGTTERAA